MAFCNNLKPERSPGNISGNPLHGLCEQMCIQAKKVFDACLSQTTHENVVVTLRDLCPPNPTPPLTFVSAASTSSHGKVKDVSIDPIPDRPNCKRVQATVCIPIEVVYTDSCGREGVGQGELCFTKDVVLNVPDNSVIPVKVAATVNVVSPMGTWISGHTFSLTVCVTILLKIEAEVELLIPSYGYCFIPPCQEFSAEACSGIF
ncbi:MAG TPA: hypothetical protein PK245_03545, partial [Clostridia bacterium]|nr:hypothetical protein [Clostridia bacterium]